MKITPEQYDAFLAQYKVIHDLAHAFAKSKDPGAVDVVLEDDGQVSYETNTACHCHPEYERQWLSSDDFRTFLQQQQQQ